MAEARSDQEKAMVAAAMLAARYLDAALRSGMGKKEIDAALLLGTESVVIQQPRSRELDAAVFRYVGVAGVDQPRIVQVGMARGG